MMNHPKRIRRPHDRKLAAWAGFRVTPEFAEQLKAVSLAYGGVAPFLRVAAEEKIQRLAPTREGGA